MNECGQGGILIRMDTMYRETSIPRLRADLNIIPVSYQGRRAFVVRDALGMIEKPVLLQGEALELIGLIDARKSLRDIQLELIRQRKGSFVSFEEVAQVFAELDSLYLLESDRYHLEKKRIMTAYERLKVRPAALKGKAYPDSPEMLREFMESILNRDDACVPIKPDKKPRALVSPHIDLAVGRKVYACAYNAVRDMKPEYVVLLGTGHSLADSFYSLTEKDFETPLGIVRTEKEWAGALKSAHSRAVASNDFAHRTEHSIEFQLVFLQHLFGSGFTLLPVLCGSFQEVLPTSDSAGDIPAVRDFLHSLRSLINEHSEETLIVAGVDFSHIGFKFGHEKPASVTMPGAENHDRALIDALCRGDARRFWGGVKQLGNRYNVCGFSCLASLMELLPGTKGKCLDYHFWNEEATQSAVSFAAAVLFGG